MKILLLSILAVAMIGLMIPNAFGIITYTEKSNHYGYAGVFKFLDWGMIPSSDGNYKILVLRGEITANTDSMKKGEGLITTPDDNFAIYNYGERNHLNYHGSLYDFDYDWKTDFTTPKAFFLTAEMYPETHYTNPLQLYYSPVIYGTVVTSKNIQLDNLENLPYLELCHDVSKAKICGLDISLKDIRIEEGSQKDLLIVEFNNKLNPSLQQITTESGSNSKDYSHIVYPYSCPFGVPSKIWEIPLKCDQGGETKIKNPEWTFWEECLSSNTKKLCFIIEKSDNSFSAASFSSDYEIKNYDTIFTIETDRESIKKSITKPSQQSSYTNENTKSESQPEPQPKSQPEPQPKVESESLEQYEIDMGISIGVPESWDGETTYFPARSKEPAKLESVLYSPNGYDEDAVISVLYYGTSVSYSDLTDNEKLEKIIKAEERFDRDNFYDRTEFISTSIKKDAGATIFTLEYESFDDSDSFYNSKTQMFEVHSDYGVWGIYLDVYKESSFARTNENIEVFDALKNSFRILGIENNNSPKIFIKSSNSATADISVPTWIKNNAGWWADGTIDDNSFVQGIQFMIKENIISIPYLENSPSDTTNSVPAWIKNNAGWWAEGQIDTSAFVEGMRYLVKVGIIKVT